ncbi:MAG: hypothetical protein AB7O26_21045 [Planctomycetaceae bacterium]
MLPPFRFVTTTILISLLLLAAWMNFIWQSPNSPAPIGMRSAQGSSLDPSLREHPSWTEQQQTLATVRRARELSRLNDLPHGKATPALASALAIQMETRTETHTAPPDKITRPAPSATSQPTRPDMAGAEEMTLTSWSGNEDILIDPASRETNAGMEASSGTVADKADTLESASVGESISVGNPSPAPSTGIAPSRHEPPKPGDRFEVVALGSRAMSQNARVPDSFVESANSFAPSVRLFDSRPRSRPHRGDSSLKHEPLAGNSIATIPDAASGARIDPAGGNVVRRPDVDASGALPSPARELAIPMPEMLPAETVQNSFASLKAQVGPARVASNAGVVMDKAAAPVLHPPTPRKLPPALIRARQLAAKREQTRADLDRAQARETLASLPAPLNGTSPRTVAATANPDPSTRPAASTAGTTLAAAPNFEVDLGPSPSPIVNPPMPQGRPSLNEMAAHAKAAAAQAQRKRYRRAWRRTSRSAEHLRQAPATKSDDTESANPVVEWFKKLAD